MTLQHTTFLLESLNLEIYILSSIMLIKKESASFTLTLLFVMPLCWNFSCGKKSIYRERQCVSLCARRKGEKPRKQWMKKFNGRLVEAEVQKHQELQVHSLGERAKKMCAFIHACSLSRVHGDWSPSEKECFASIFWWRYALVRLVSGVDQK